MPAALQYSMYHAPMFFWSTHSKQLVQVYLGRWQQTDVAVKVLSKVMQNLSPHSGIVPQDPSTLQAWHDTPEIPFNTNASAVSTGSSAPENLDAMKVLEREVLSYCLPYEPPFRACG